MSSFAILGACANDPKNQIPVPSPAATQAKEAMTKETAARLAAAHLSLKQLNWGEAENVVDKGDAFLVFFKTPEQERRLIGPRVLVVNKETGSSIIQKRR